MKDQLHFIFKLLLVFILISQMTQCRKDETETNIIGSTLVMDHEDVSFIIVVIDEQGAIVKDAFLSIANESQVIQANEHGVCFLNKIGVTDIGRRIKVTKEGYFPQIKMLTGESHSKNTMEVVLIKETEGTLINTGEASTIDGGGELLLPSNLIEKAGATYSGPVRVKSKYFDPDDGEYIQQGPGNMIGLNAEDEYVILGSLGMYYIELYHPDTGEELNIPANSSATISFPIAEIQKGTIPASIPLWSMDEDSGVWNYEGEAILKNDRMVAEVSHFSFWNCDLPYTFVPFCATFVTANGQPVVGVEVDFFVNNQGFGNEMTNQMGKICGNLPIEAIIDLVYSFDHEIIGEGQIGEFLTTPVDLIIEVPSLPLVNGNAVDCNQIPVTNGYGIINTDNSAFPIYLSVDGSFEYLMNNKDHNLLLVNHDTNEFTNQEVAASTVIIELGEIEICDPITDGYISGMVMLDSDEDGISDSPESNVTINVKNVLTDQIDFIAVTNEAGEYSIAVIPMVEYELSIEEVSDKVLMYHGDNTPDDVLTNEGWTFMTRQGFGARLNDATESDEDNDFQLVNKGMGTVKGNIQLDTNGDFIGDEPSNGFFGVSIKSFTVGTEQYQSMAIDANGDFTLNTSNFIGEIQVLLGSVSDFDSSPDPDGDDQALGANNVIPIRLISNEEDEDNNFVIGKGSIGGFVKFDVNNDDVGDIPIEGIRIGLFSAAITAFQTTTFTDENGHYLFDNMPPGDYILAEQQINEIYPDAVDVFDGDESPEDENDAVDGLKDNIIRVTLLNGEFDDDNNFVEERLGSISGKVSEDTDNDGLGDKHGEGRVIEIYKLDGELVVSLMSDENGEYSFRGFHAGEYYVKYEVMAGFEIIQEGDDSPEDANDAIDSITDGIIFITIEPEEHDNDNNFIDRKI